MLVQFVKGLTAMRVGKREIEQHHVRDVPVDQLQRGLQPVCFASQLETHSAVSLEMLLDQACVAGIILDE